MISSVTCGVSGVSFPTWTGERQYMVPFTKGDGLPEPLRRWQRTVDQMLFGVEAGCEIFFMADQGEVDEISPHRRPGLHIDGNWNPEIFAHGWRQPFHGDYSPELTILCSDVEASRAVIGVFDGYPAIGGDCAHIDVSSGRSVRMNARTVYIGNVTMVHESLPVARARRVKRSLVRLSVPLQ